MSKNDADPLESAEPIDYRDEAVLRRFYTDLQYTIPEIADASTVTTTTIHRWLKKYGIERRNSGGGIVDSPEDPIDHTDRDTLHRLYVEEEKSLQQIAELSSVCDETIRDYMERHGIDRRERIEATRSGSRVEYADYQPAGNEYMIWKDYWCGEQVSVHRLLAVAEYGYDEVADKVVHHKNNVRWDNRPENIELMTASEHAKHHTENGDFVIGPSDKKSGGNDE